MRHLLSKSKYIRGLQCERALWLDCHCPHLARYSHEQMRRFDAGREFEHSFKATFPQGVDVSAALGRRINEYPAYTARLLDEDAGGVLFEAGFLYDEVLVLADVVRQRADGSLEVYEVKSGSTLSNTYRRDAALQHYVISHCRRVERFCIVHALPPTELSDREPLPDGGDSQFAIVELTAELQAEACRVASNIATMKGIVLASSEPDTPTGQHCLEPYACPYQHYCQQGVRQMSLFE